MRKRYLFFLILLVATFLRFFQLGVNPPSLTWDEVSWGYNAFALGIDGRDEFGRVLPYNYLESFGDFKPPMYAYLDIIPIKLLGLTEFATRFPSALFGVMTVAMTYALVLLLFEKSEKKKHYAIVSSFLLAISPWHLMLSRAAFEANVSTFFLVSGVTCFLYAMQKKQGFLILSVVSFVFSMYTFNTSRIVAPLLIITLLIIFWKRLLEKKKISLIAAVVGFLIFLPTISFLFSPQARLRFQEVNIFSNISVIQTANQQVSNDQNAIWSKILHNRRTLFAGEFMKHYLDNLSFHFLFISGDGNPKFSIQDVGQMYIWELPFLLLGILLLFRFHEGRWYLIPLWLLLGIIPAATARETPHALRIETTLPTFQILVAYGVVQSYALLTKYKQIFIVVISLVVGVNLLYFLHSYYYTYPREFSSEWQYGYKSAISYVNQTQSSYDQVVVTTALGRPYIYFLYYLQIPPSYFRQHAVVKRDTFGFVNVTEVGKYIFTGDINAVNNKSKTLSIWGANEKVPASWKLLKTFYLPNDKPILKAYSI